MQSIKLKFKTLCHCNFIKKSDTCRIFLKLENLILGQFWALLSHKKPRSLSHFKLDDTLIPCKKQRKNKGKQRKKGKGTLTHGGYLIGFTWSVQKIIFNAWFETFWQFMGNLKWMKFNYKWLDIFHRIITFNNSWKNGISVFQTTVFNRLFLLKVSGTCFRGLKYKKIRNIFGLKCPRLCELCWNTIV